MAAMVIAPFAAARQWTDRLGVAAGLAGLFGVLAGVAGSVLSSETERLPTGPTIVLCVTAIVLVSLVAAGRRGLLWRELRGRRDRRTLRLAAVLADLLELERQHPDAHRGHAAAVLSVMSGGALPSLQELERRGQVRRLGDDAWELTDAGREAAER
jgi:manganese/zinc/iron transport system permease protein